MPAAVVVNPVLQRTLWMVATRIDPGLTQELLSSAAGIARGSVSAMVNGRTPMDVGTLGALLSLSSDPAQLLALLADPVGCDVSVRDHEAMSLDVAVRAAQLECIETAKALLTAHGDHDQMRAAAREARRAMGTLLAALGDDDHGAALAH